MPSTTLAQEAEALPPIGKGVPPAISRDMALVIAIGIFVSTFAQDQVVAKLPFQHVLTTELHANAWVMSKFFGWAGLAWYFKPIFGILSDAVPFFGTRRRHYMLLGAMASTLLWAGYILAPVKYLPFVLLIVGINTALVLTSTVSGGLLVEEGQRAGATGKLSSVRNVSMCVAGLVAGPISGYLADMRFSWTAIVGSATCGVLMVSAYFLLPERKGAVLDRGALKNIGWQLRTAIRSRAMWLAALFTFLVTFAPGFQSPLYIYQTQTLHLTDKFLGVLLVFNNGFGILGSVLYILLCRRMNLGWVVVISIGAQALAALGYLDYHTKPQTMVVESLYGFAQNIATVMTLDVAAQATPKGCEAMAYALLMSAYNIATKVSDLIGSWLISQPHLSLLSFHTVHQLSFTNLVWINTVTSLMTLFAIPLLPRAMLRHYDTQTAE